jgi:hypothetical protein
MKSVLTMAVAGTTLAGLAALVAVGVLILIIIPGGLAILTIEFGRVRWWLRRARKKLMRTNPKLRTHTYEKEQIEATEP